MRREREDARRRPKRRSDPSSSRAIVCIGDAGTGMEGDMSYPVRVLQALRDLLVEGGSVVIADELVADSFTAPGDDLERLYYGFSVLHCLPVGMVGDGAAGTGTVMRADTVRSYGEQAGFTTFEVLPIENDFYCFYRLTP